MASGVRSILGTRSIRTCSVIQSQFSGRGVTLKPFEIEYNRDLKSLEDVISRVKRHGDFFVAGAMEVPMPKVEVDGAGTLSFPVPEAQVGSLVRHAQRAPYGKGEKTVTDPSVGKVWQIDPDKVRVGGKSWSATFEAMLSKVRAGLGCDGVAVATPVSPPTK